MPKSKYDVIIIGAGASGLFCANRLVNNKISVLIIEKNSIPGKKLSITGKGRCNVTNNCSPDDILNATRHNNKFLKGAIYNFSPSDTIDFFEKNGVKLKTERGNRVFPVSDKASEIVNCLYNRAKTGTDFLFNEEVKDISYNDSSYDVLLSSGNTVSADNLIIATGGKSYHGTGSTGDGYKFAEKLGHKITDIQPSLVPIVTKEKWPADCMGLSLKNVELSVYEENGKNVYNELGEMLFTHFGISGPLVLSASSHMNARIISKYIIKIDLKPGLDENKLDNRILRDFREKINLNFSNSLGNLLPSSIVPVIIKESGISPTKKVNQITQEERKKLTSTIKGLTLHTSKFRPIDEAIITSGGVDVKDISSATMESKLNPGLYFIGEILDMDAYTGGYNLQIAFSTADACSRAIIKKINK